VWVGPLARRDGLRDRANGIREGFELVLEVGGHRQVEGS
jgi:hypothetical protein